MFIEDTAAGVRQVQRRNRDMGETGTHERPQIGIHERQRQVRETSTGETGKLERHVEE
jgi:hypothetical protein